MQYYIIRLGADNIPNRSEYAHSLAVARELADSCNGRDSSARYTIKEATTCTAISLPLPISDRQ
jgi:hypothetical protein